MMGNMRILETEALVTSMQNRADEYKELQTQFNNLRKAFQQIVNLESFKGQGANAIKNFYQAQMEVIDAWLVFIDIQCVFLNDMPNILGDHELDQETLVQVPFLENDLGNAHRQAKNMVYSQQESLQGILDTISDIIPLKTLPRDGFIEQWEKANNKRQQMIDDTEILDERLLGEYGETEPEQRNVLNLFGALLDATSQDGTLSPIHFDSQAFHSSQAYELKDDVLAHRDAYLDMKQQQNDDRKLKAEMEELENAPWYKKLWHHGSTFVGEVTGYYDYIRAKDGIDPLTGAELSEAQRIKAGAFAAAGFIPFVGWAGRAFKGGKAIYSTAKGVKAIDSSLDVYKTTKSFEYLHKAEYGIYGLASANGFGEYITGNDMFGNPLSDEQRTQSLTEALFVLGVGGAGYGFDRVTGNLHFVNREKAVSDSIVRTKLEYKTSSGMILRNTPNHTTTILGNYQQDMKHVVNELGNVKSTNFGPRNNGFNVLNTPDDLYKNPGQFWKEYNQPWLDNAIKRNDPILMATDPIFGQKGKLLRRNFETGKYELSGFGKEYYHLRRNGYIFDVSTKTMKPMN